MSLLVHISIAETVFLVAQWDIDLSCITWRQRLALGMPSDQSRQMLTVEECLQRFRFPGFNVVKMETEVTLLTWALTGVPGYGCDLATGEIVKSKLKACGIIPRSPSG